MMITQRYVYQGVNYDITDTAEVHNLLDDEIFFSNYLKENSSTVEVSITEKENKDDPNNFSWNDDSTKLLVAEYTKRKCAFRDPKKKKILLWREIKNKFEDKGYNVSEVGLDRKFRNMKHHFKTVVDNNKKNKTGRGKICWQYFNEFEEIFSDDKTVFSGNNIMSSLDFTQVTPVAPNLKVNDFTLASFTENDSSSLEHSMQQNNTSISLSSVLQTESVPAFSCQSRTSSFKTLPVSEKLTTACQPQEKVKDSTPAREMRGLYKFRQSLVSTEERRIEAIQLLTEELKEHNRIQRERNEIIKKIYNVE